MLGRKRTNESDGKIILAISNVMVRTDPTPSFDTVCFHCNEKDVDLIETDTNLTFCSTICHSLWRKTQILGRNHWLRRDDGTMYYGRNYQRMREKVIKRDEFCQVDGCDADPSLEPHEVHHIVPVDSFFFPEEANTMDNMIYLCKQHHSDVEAGKIRSPRPDIEKKCQFEI